MFEILTDTESRSHKTNYEDYRVKTAVSYKCKGENPNI
jgi:hypothetical protein